MSESSPVSLLPRLLIVGYTEPFHVGFHLYQAAQQAGIEAKIINAQTAYQSSWLLSRINWRFRNHRPAHLDSFSQNLLQHCIEYKPDVVLVTGITPPNADTLTALRDLGISCVNYLTDDPWNSHHFSPWFFKALPHYTHVFSPRQSNLDDLRRLGCAVSYLPFAYNPTIHYHEAPPSERSAEFECDVLFYGGADADRVPYIENLIGAGFKVHLYGGYWDRYAKTRAAFRGIADAKTLRWAVSCAKITLCLVRRANRDGHVMRSFEAPAMGACMLTEDTEEHRELLGESVVYFHSPHSLIEKTHILLQNLKLRLQLTQAATQQIVNTGNTYLDRLTVILRQ